MSIPQSLPKLFKEYYKNYEHKDYGIGKYKPLLDYSKDIKETKESTDSQEQSISITHTRVFLSPFKANKLNFTFALGLDDYLDKDNITELKIVIKGVYDEERESNLVTLASNDDRLEYEVLEEDKYASISLKFNGKFLTIIIKEKNTIKRISFQAVSGRPQKINGKHYFTYEKERQMLESEGPIPEGEYYIDVGKISEVPFYRLDRQYGWGNKNIPIELNNQETYGRDGFYIHGGWSAGSAGCIDLWDKNEMFFEKLIEHSKKLNITKIPLIIKYENNAKVECEENLFLMLKKCKAI